MAVDVYSQCFTAHSGAIFFEESTRLTSFNEQSKILLCPTALEEMATKSLVYPLQFRIAPCRSAPSAPGASLPTAYCGVKEFIAPEGCVILPLWRMDVLGITDGDRVWVSTENLPKGSLVKLRPHSVSFTQLSNPKAVLESQLRNFTCLSAGSTIPVFYQNDRYDIDILEVRSTKKQERAIVIVDVDLKVEFERPLDMPEDSPERPLPQKIVTNAVPGEVRGLTFGGGNFVPPTLVAPQQSPHKNSKEAAEEQEPPAPHFVPFAGAGRCLRGAPRAQPSPPPPRAPQVAPTTAGAEINRKPPQDSTPPSAPVAFKPFQGEGRRLR